MEYNKLEGLGVIGKELDNAKLELTREKNLYEYGIDIINNTERMSLNRKYFEKTLLCNYFLHARGNE